MRLRQRLVSLGAGGALLLAAAFIGEKEGVSLVPYKDIGGVNTWCYGQTVGHSKARYTAQECDTDLLGSVRGYHKAVMQELPADTPASVQAAFTSAAYNAGVNRWRKSQMPVLARKGLWKAACDVLIQPRGVSRAWVATVNGKPVRGLENRRRAEHALCLEDL